jgi:hypothetical protein
MTPEQIAALVDQKVAEKTAHLQAHVDQLIKEKRKLIEDRKQPEDSFERVMRDADAVLASSKPDPEFDRVMRAADKLLAPKTNLPSADRVCVPRHADPATYRELKAQAEKRGVPLVFVEEGPGDPTQRNFGRDANSRVKFVETDATFYANQAMQRSLGIVELDRRAAAAGKSLRIFRSADDLVNDPEALQKHARILDAADPDTLVFGG